MADSGYTIKVDAGAFVKLMADIESKYGKGAQENLLDEFALLGHAGITKVTPKDRGQTRQAWSIQRREGAREIVNASPVMKFLNDGTKAHGPVRGDFLWFKPRKGKNKGKLIRTRWVKGIEARHYIENYIPVFLKQIIDKLLRIAGTLQ